MRTGVTYSDPGIAGESAPQLVLTQRQPEEWKNFRILRKKSLQVCSDWRLLTWGSWKGAN